MTQMAQMMLLYILFGDALHVIKTFRQAMNVKKNLLNYTENTT